MMIAFLLAMLIFPVDADLWHKATARVTAYLVHVVEHTGPEHAVEVGVVRYAMESMARKAWPFNLGDLCRRWKQDCNDTADAIVHAAHHHDIDPMLLVVVSWREAKFKSGALGDLRAGKPRSCGPTQIRVDIRGRPSCDALMDPMFAFDWTAGFLATYPRRSDGSVDMDEWNGPKAAESMQAQLDALHARVERNSPVVLVAVRNGHPTAHIGID